MQPLESRPQAARILTFRKVKRICRLHLNRVPFVYTLSVTAAFLGLTPVFCSDVTHGPSPASRFSPGNGGGSDQGEPPAASGGRERRPAPVLDRLTVDDKTRYLPSS